MILLSSNMKAKINVTSKDTQEKLSHQLFVIC